MVEKNEANKNILNLYLGILESTKVSSSDEIREIDDIDYYELSYEDRYNLNNIPQKPIKSNRILLTMVITKLTDGYDVKLGFSRTE